MTETGTPAQPGVRLRHAARAIILDPDNRVLLCRFAFPDKDIPNSDIPDKDLSDRGIVVWAAPGGGVEPGETPLAALRRELREETGLDLDSDPPHVWHQVVVEAGHADGYDGVINDYFLVRTAAFEPRGEMSDEELAAEHISDLVWWPLADIAGYSGTDLFSPRDLAAPLTALVEFGTPLTPVPLGL